LLRELAALYDIQLSYTDRKERRHRAPRSTVLAVLQSLGAPVQGLRDAPDALRARRLDLWRRRLEPVTVAWDGRMPEVRLRLPKGIGDRARLWIDTDAGHRFELRAESGLRQTAAVDLEGRSFAEAVLPAVGAPQLPFGYHRLTLGAGGEETMSLVISAPSRANPSPPEHRWGVFLPLHALRTRRSLGIGDFTDLRSLTEWIASKGASMVAVLPMLAAFLDGPLFEASPYSPASRLFWNELWIDPEATPELERSREARELLASSGYRREAARLASSDLIDYRAVMAAKRRALEALARTHWAELGPRRQAFAAFARANPRLLDYASFRAACERHGTWWGQWPARERDGRLPRDGGNAEAARYHAYVQWLAEEQLARTAQRARSSGAALYFDLPLGVNPAGYDAWRDRDAFLSGVAAGAPPDLFFRKGQDWGFQPLSPEGIRQQGYRYPIAVTRHMLRHAGLLRIDHAAGLHRLFVIPRGMSATEGLYVRYRPEELYAILCLESRRSGTVLVGEDLGNVPLAVTQALLRHGIQRTYVMQFELLRKRPGVRPPQEHSVAAFNTHDMATFAAFWRALDVDLWAQIGIVDREEVAALKADREKQKHRLVEHLVSEGLLGPERVRDEDAVCQAMLASLARGPAKMMLLALEDLWHETRPQNIPGTTDQYPNWRRRARFSFESFRRRPEVTSTLARIDQLRKRGERS
jgi:4-alpha-glucanotransferase